MDKLRNDMGRCPDPALIGKLLELPDGERRELVKRALEAQGWEVKLERDGITIRKKPAE